jgi:hypothetical protein
MLGLAQLLFQEVSPPFEVVIPFRWCQDHLERLHSALRARNGFYTNPSPFLYKSAVRSILAHAQIRIGNGNCMELSDLPVLQDNKNLGNLYFINNKI